MSKIIILYKIIILILAFLSLASISPTYATINFSDTFIGGYSSNWQTNPNSLTPLLTSNGISAASNSQWSDLMLPLNENLAIKINFDLKININNTNSAWRLYLINNTFDKYKIINNWGPNNQLQISEASGIDVLNEWTHSVGTHHFEITISPKANTSIVILEDNIKIIDINTVTDFNLAYLNIGLLGLGDFEISNFNLTNEVVIVTPTPTTPPTPTPTPNISKKVVVIPGFGASWNADALFNCKAEGYAGPWVLHPLEKAVYPSLYTALSNAGFTPLPFYYDWRPSLGSQNAGLSSFISSNTAPNESVDIVGHSFGGLVGRAYLTDHPNDSRVSKYISAGSPHSGVVQAYPAWAAGEIHRSDFNYWVYITTMLRLCQIRYKIDAQEAIHRFIPSTQDILPTFPYLRDEKTKQLKPLGLMQTLNTWLSAHPFPANINVIIGTLAGTGQQTISTLVTKNPSKNDIQNGKWLDGKVIKYDYSTAGDGTVLTQSSQIPDADNRTIPGTHTSIIDSDTGQQEIISFLGGTPTIQSSSLRSMPLAVKINTSALLVLSYPAHATILDPKGNTVTDTDGLIAIDNPSKGKYHLSVSPKKFGNTKIIIAQFYEDGTYFWKEYNHRLPIRKNMKFFIDPNHPTEDLEHE